MTPAQIVKSRIVSQSPPGPIVNYSRWKAIRLREHREKSGLSLEHVANEFGFTAPYLSQMERGVREPTLHMAYRLAAFYGAAVTDVWIPHEQTEEQSA